MIETLKENSLVSQIIDNYNNSIVSLKFHKDSHKIIELMTSTDFLSKVFEMNLLDNIFLSKKWTSFDIPYLDIFSNNDFDLRIHIFSPTISNNVHSSYLIHHHMDYILSSYVFFGEGYHTIEYEKSIVDNADGTYQLNISKDFFHANGTTNIVDSFVPHILFNVSEPTATLVLWSKCNQGMDLNKRENYYLDNSNFLRISDKEFLIEAKKVKNYEDNSEKHVQAICYFIQQIGYKSPSFIKQILKRSDLPNTWYKWLSLLLLGDHINFPYFNDKINTLNKQMSIEDIRNANNKF